MEKFELAITVLLTGFVIVFLVLFILIIVIKIYGSVVYNFQNKKSHKEINAVTPSNNEKAAQALPVDLVDDNEVSDEIIAVIAAAVGSMYSTKSHVIKSVKRVKNERSSWSMAGLIDCTRPF